ncbi:MAG: phosphatase PAP2 family protein [Desulfobacteraceae bacterium]|nr:MAG: phosphatase PAP2 family protein [Desulfobacteraceae bacterium]
MTGCGWFRSSPIPKNVLEVRPGIVEGYLSLDKSPDILMLLPPPPAEVSASFAADQEVFRETRSLKNGQRWDQAAKDANLLFPAAPEAFSCALNAPITRGAMPNLYMLMHRTMSDAGYATFAAKNRYKRTRPFVANSESSCTPEDEEKLAKDGSYPSGHSSIGWTWALILAEIAPDRADAILSRGYAFGQSRVICGVHWQSDVHAGRVVAAAVVAKLHTDKVFLAQLAAAKKELTAARAKGFKPSRDCEAEASALGLGWHP